jgi:hypothetical protein
VLKYYILELPSAPEDVVEGAALVPVAVLVRDVEHVTRKYRLLK